MLNFRHVTDRQVRALLEGSNEEHRDHGEVAYALSRTMRAVMRDSYDTTVPQRAVEIRSVHCIEAEDAFRRRDIKAAVEALRAVWSDAPVARLPALRLETT